MTGRELCIGLNMLSGFGYARYRALCEAFSDLDDLRNADRGTLQEIPGIGKILAERMIGFDWDAELSRECAVATRGGVKIVTLADPDYPEALHALFDPPLCLYIRGNLPSKNTRSVAIVGSRRISAYGEKMSETLAAAAVGCGYVVYSGLASGADTAAHRAVLNNSGITVGVLGGGLMHVYPKENISLARSIIQNGGAVISEFPLDFPVSRQNFPRRNRIVAAMSDAVIVTEAGINSGALITARLALEMGKEVFALPGRVDNFQAQGCHKLIKEGAALIENFDDVRSALESGLSSSVPQPSAGKIDLNNLSPECAAICRVLAEHDADADELQERTGMKPGPLLAALNQLEFNAMIVRDSDLFYHLC